MAWVVFLMSCRHSRASALLSLLKTWASRLALNTCSGARAAMGNKRTPGRPAGGGAPVESPASEGVHLWHQARRVAHAHGLELGCGQLEPLHDVIHRDV
mmetsp:Transcript_42935/g.109849  ORF Transcript_42935/g.109849 Transcript_42935/m.109849 type:complete len:99 (+) Transcript_42935:2099-2395(+)